MARTATIQARVNSVTKTKAKRVLDSLHMSMSQAVALYLQQIVFHKGIPFQIKIPDKATFEAVKELESGKAISVDSVDEMLKDLKS